MAPRGSISKEYNAWCNIKQRISNCNRREFSRYGGRGITFQWQNDFEGFLNYIGKAPSDGQRWSVERIDVDGNYEEGNIVWATDCRQAQNRRKPITNHSGVTGVAFHLKKKKSGKQYTSAVAQVRINSRNVTKNFSVSKYGLLESFAMACHWRKVMIQELNVAGANYSEKHGK
jgi:hypothetical protein